MNEVAETDSEEEEEDEVKEVEEKKKKKEKGTTATTTIESPTSPPPEEWTEVPPGGWMNLNNMDNPHNLRYKGMTCLYFFFSYTTMCDTCRLLFLKN